MEKKNIISIEDRIPKLKQTRKKKANRRLIYYLCAFFILISLIIYVQSPLSHVKHFNVKGNELVGVDELIKLSGIETKDNIWSIDFKKAEERLTNSPYIRKATVKRKLPRTVELIITEEKLVGYTIKERVYYPILGNGINVDRPYKVMNGKAPLLHGFSDEEYLEKMAKELTELDPSIHRLISEIYWNPTEDNKNKITLYMQDGFIVKGTIRQFHEKMSVYPSIISQLEPNQRGIIHIGIGAYFEEF